MIYTSNAFSNVLENAKGKTGVNIMISGRFGSGMECAAKYAADLINGEGESTFLIIGSGTSRDEMTAMFPKAEMREYASKIPNQSVGDGTIIFASMDARRESQEVKDLLTGMAKRNKIIIANTSDGEMPAHVHQMSMMVNLSREDFDGAPVRKGEIMTRGLIEDPFYFTLENGGKVEFKPFTKQTLYWENTATGDFRPYANYQKGWASTGTPNIDRLIHDEIGKEGIPKGSGVLLDIGQGVGEYYWPVILNYSKNAAALAAGVKAVKGTGMMGFMDNEEFSDTTYENVEEGAIKICSPGTARGRVRKLINTGLPKEATDMVKYIELSEGGTEYSTSSSASDEDAPMMLKGLDGDEVKKTTPFEKITDAIIHIRNEKNKRMAIDVSVDAVREVYGEDTPKQLSRLLRYAEENGDTVLAYDKNCDKDIRKIFNYGLAIRKLDEGIHVMRNLKKREWNFVEYRALPGRMGMSFWHIR